MNPPGQVKDLRDWPNVWGYLEPRYAIADGRFVFTQDGEGDLHIITFCETWGCGFHYIFMWCGDDFYLWSIIGMDKYHALKEMDMFIEEEDEGLY